MPDQIVIDLVLREDMARKMAEARKAVAAMTEEEKKATVTSAQHAAAMSKTEEKTRKQADQNKATTLSFTELNSALEIGRKALGYVEQAYNAVIAPTVAYAAQIRELSRTIGASAEESSKLIQAADDVGIEVGTIQAAMEAAIRKGVRPSIDGLAELANRYNDIQDPITQTKFLMDNFGRSGADLAPLMKLGSAGIREAGEAALETGQVMSEQGVASARQYEIAMDNLGDRVEGLKIKLGTSLIPALTSTMDRQNNALAVMQLLQQGFSTGKLLVGDYATAIRHLESATLTGAFTGDKLTDVVDMLNAKLKEAKPAIVADTEAQIKLAQTGEYLNGVEQDLIANASKFADGHDLMAQASTRTSQAMQAAQDALNNSMRMLNLEMAGPVSKEMDSYNEKQADLAKNAAKIKAELDKLQASQGAVAKSDTKNVMSATELALAQAKVRAATEDLNSATRTLSKTKGTASETDAEFAVRVAGLRNEIADQTDKMGKANQSVTSYVDNSKRIAELKGEYADVNLAISKNADAHDEATKRIMFDLVSQRAAVGGLTSDEMKALNDIALQWGLVDQKTHDAVVGIDSALAGLATGTSIDAFISQIDGIAAAANNANAAFQTMMSQQAGLHGGPGTAAPSASPTAPPAYALPTEPIRQAGGGDWMVNRPTLFLAGEAGPERATFTPMQGGRDTYNSTRGGDTYVINDPHTGALLMEMQRRERQRAAANVMG